MAAVCIDPEPSVVSIPPPVWVSRRTLMLAVASTDTLYGLAVDHERFIAAAQHVLDGDDSIRAANALEGVVLDDFPGDERFDELSEALALYAPGKGFRTPRQSRSEK